MTRQNLPDEAALLKGEHTLLTLSILAPSIGRNRRLGLSVHGHLAGLRRRIRRDIRPVGHSLEIVIRLVNGGRDSRRRCSTADQVHLLAASLVPEIHSDNILRKVDGATLRSSVSVNRRGVHGVPRTYLTSTSLPL